MHHHISPLHRRIGVGLVIGGGGTIVMVNRNKDVVIPRPMKDGICGASGELLQILVLYPVESIKVRCQDQGIGWAKVVSQVLTSPGGIKSLWSGLGASAVFSILVGAVHWLSFSAAKRLVKSSTLEGKDRVGDEVRANFVVAGIGALCTATVESPVEEFRHRAQAGLISGNLGKEMMTSVRSLGLLSLYASFVPFLVEALPYDVTELSCYSNLVTAFTEIKRKSQLGSLSSTIIQSLPEGTWDLILGGTAGGAAVLVSLPFDTIKTKQQTGISRSASNPHQQVAAFFRIGRGLVMQKGVRSLFVGLAPRLVQQIPGSALCWWGVKQADNLMAGIKEG